MATVKMTRKDVEDRLETLVGGKLLDLRKELEENQRQFSNKLFAQQFQEKQKTLVKGQGAARFIRALALGKGDPERAARIVRKDWNDEAIEKSLLESTFSAGGALVPVEFAREIIDLLRARAVVRASGAQTITMTYLTLNLPKQTGPGTASYIGEAVNIPPSDQTFDQVTLTAKKLAALTAISNDLIRDTSPSADTLVRDDLVTVMALREDLAFIRGDGTGNTPTGLRNQADPANVFASNGITLQLVTDDLTTMIRLIEEANVPMTRMGWLMTPRSKWFLMSLRDGNGNLVFQPEMVTGNLFGIPFKTSTQIPNNLGVGVNESEIYLADFAQTIIGENEQLIVQVFEDGAFFDGVNVVSGISTDQTVVRTIARHDFAVRHPLAISVLTGVLWGA